MILFDVVVKVPAWQPLTPVRPPDTHVAVVHFGKTVISGEVVATDNPHVHGFLEGIMKLKNCLIAAVLLGVSTPAIADASIESVPTSWRLQNYIGGDMVAYFTGTTCSYGSILIPFSASTDEKNRFWALVMTAKATGKTVGIYYETTSGTCRVTSFYEP